MSAGKLSVKFEEKVITLRGQAFTFREITGDEYDKILKLTTGPDGTADLAPVLKLMVIASCVDPKITADEYGAFPLGLVRELNRTVNELHFGENQPGVTS